MSAVILPETFQFLELLKNNNNREWFNDNKNLYLQAHENVIEFVDEIPETISGKIRRVEIRNNDNKKE